MSRIDAAYKGHQNQWTFFHLDEDRPNFEAVGRANGGKYWYARDFLSMRGQYGPYLVPGISSTSLYNVPTLNAERRSFCCLHNRAAFDSVTRWMTSHSI